MSRKPSRYSTTSEAEIRRLVAQGLKFTEIAAKLNVSLPNFRNACSVLGIKSPTAKTRFDLDGWVSRLERGDSLREIADDCGITREYAHQILKNAGRPSCSRAAVKAKYAAVAQLAEQGTCSAQVAGSTPASGSTNGVNV